MARTEEAITERKGEGKKKGEVATNCNKALGRLPCGDFSRLGRDAA